MKRKVPFTKMVGAGNDFILVDARKNPLGGSASRLAQRWCDRKQGIGADGLLVITPSSRADARMRIFNPDGSEAAMCGNGLRCAAWFLHSQGNLHGALSPVASAKGSSFASLRTSLTTGFCLETGAGRMFIQITGRQRTRIFLTPPRKLELHRRLTIGKRRLWFHSVDTGVPHAVLITSRLAQIPLDEWGPVIRNHPLFRPAGTNVNFIRIHSARRISIRTYERGVEAETLACGTGACASVVVATALGHLRPPVQVVTAGGETLRVGFRQGDCFEQGSTLEGSAKILFEGAIPL